MRTLSALLHTIAVAILAALAINAALTDRPSAALTLGALTLALAVVAAASHANLTSTR